MVGLTEEEWVSLNRDLQAVILHSFQDKYTKHERNEFNCMTGISGLRLYPHNSEEEGAVNQAVGEWIFTESGKKQISQMEDLETILTMTSRAIQFSDHVEIEDRVWYFTNKATQIFQDDHVLLGAYRTTMPNSNPRGWPSSVPVEAVWIQIYSCLTLFRQYFTLGIVHNGVGSELYRPVESSSLLFSSSQLPEETHITLETYVRDATMAFSTYYCQSYDVPVCNLLSQFSRPSWDYDKLRVTCNAVTIIPNLHEVVPKEGLLLQIMGINFHVRYVDVGRDRGRFYLELKALQLWQGERRFPFLWLKLEPPVPLNRGTQRTVGTQYIPRKRRLE